MSKTYLKLVLCCATSLFFARAYHNLALIHSNQAQLYKFIKSFDSADRKLRLFFLVDSEGNEVEEEQMGLLLYKGGTVCDDHFDNDAADAICREMNFTQALSWTIDDSFEIQQNYDIKLDNVNCSTADWENCTFSKYSDCFHSEDVFMSCTSKSYTFSIII